MKQVEIFTDGACSGNPGPGGWGAVLRFGSAEKELCGGEENTTNNRMELSAVIAALSALKEPCRVLLTTDSQYVVNRHGKRVGQKMAGQRLAQKRQIPGLEHRSVATAFRTM